MSGPRTWMSVTCREQDRKVFEDMGFGAAFYDINETTEPAPGILYMTETESDGHYEELQKLRVPFLASQDLSYEYDSLEWASDGKTTISVVASKGGIPVVEVSSDGEPDRDQLKLVREFRTLEKKVQDLFGLKEG